MSTRRSGLGRGLGSLIPTDVANDGTERAFVEVPIDQIDPNPNQPRKSFDEEEIEALTASIAELGVLQPVLVRRREDGRYELIAGERRWRAARRAGLTEVPALVRAIDDVTSLAEAVVENIHRQNLNPMEEAGAYRQLLEDFELTHEELATKMGRSRVAITNTIRLLQLPAGVQRLVADGGLSAGHARAILAVPDGREQMKIAQLVVSEGLSVRATEELTRPEPSEPEPSEPETQAPASPGPGRPAPASKLRDPALLELEEILSERFATNVSVNMNAKRGRIVIDFATLDDLERIFGLLSPGVGADHGE